MARAANSLRITPTQLTLLGAVIGIVAGALLYNENLGLLAFGLLIVHGIVDSADGQLARMTGQVTEFGRVMDGVSGYVTHIAIYVAITSRLLHDGGSWIVIVWMFCAAVANALQAQMYEYHRPAYSAIVGEGRLPKHNPGNAPAWVRWLYRAYLNMQQRQAGLHVQVEKQLATRMTAGYIREEDRTLYQRCFYWPVRGWNLLGDNTRFYAIGVLALLNRTELFFAFILIPMMIALFLLRLWQHNADRKFLSALS